MDAPVAPTPVQTPLPLLIGGGGEQKTLRIAAKYANEWNVWGTPELLKRKMAILDQHCADIGRDPKEIKRSAPIALPKSSSQSRARPSGQSGSDHVQSQVRFIREPIPRTPFDENAEQSSTHTLSVCTL